VALAKEGKAKLSDELKSQAEAALASAENLNRFGPELRKVLPQLDRLCWSTVEGDKLHIRRCVQEPEHEQTVGGEGRKVDRRITKLAGYAERTEPVVNSSLTKERGIDLQFMARVYKSSVHFPVEIEGLKGSLNFWSTEADAFPPEAVSLLGELVKVMK
jgi:hypothetical protein